MGRAEIGVLTALLALAATAAPSQQIAQLVAQQVSLPLAGYEALRARARPAPEAAPAPPAPFALAADEIEIEIAAGAGAGSARVVQRLTLTLYASGWQSVPLGLAGSFVAARLADLEGRVATSGEGSALVVRGAGEHPVELESVLPVTRDETATAALSKLALKPPPAAVVHLRLRVPATVEEAALDDPASGLVRRLADGSWEIAAAPGAALSIALRGRPLAPPRAALPLRFEAVSASAALASRTALKVHGWIEARVVEGRLARLLVPLPEGLRPVAVRGPLAGWTVEAGSLAMTPLAPVLGSLAVEVELAGAPEDAFLSPALAPAGSARTLLYARAAVAGDGILDLADPGAARAADESEAARLPAGFRDSPGRLYALPDPARRPRWAIAWAERTEVLAAEVDRLRLDVLAGESGRASYELWAVVRNRGAEELALTLPAGFELALATRDGVPVAPGTTAGGALAVPLAAGATEDVAQVVHLSGILPFALPAGGGDLALPLPALSAPVARIEVRALLPGGRSYALADESRLSGVSPPPAVAVAAPPREAPGSPGSEGLEPGAAALAERVEAAARSGGANAAAAAARPLPRPAGFVEVDAAWSALSASPQPLVLHVRPAKEKEPWF